MQVTGARDVMTVTMTTWRRPVMLRRLSADDASVTTTLIATLSATATGRLLNSCKSNVIQTFHKHIS